MESEHSYSGESSSTSSSSGGSSEPDDESLEPVYILGNSLELPQDLCEDFGIFREFFSMRVWESLEDTQQEHLKSFLPTFPQNDKEEKDKTVQMLFTRETFHFTSPLNDFYVNLRQGNYRPDIAKMKKFLLKARAKQQRHKIRSYYSKLMPEVLISRERLLAAARAAPPGPTPRLPVLPPKPSSRSHYKPPHVRARLRYFEELVAIRSEVGGEDSDDENYPEGPPKQFLRRQRKHLSAPPVTNAGGGVASTLGGLDPSQPPSLESLKNVLAAHRERRINVENHPELNTTGISLTDIKQRVANVNGTKKLPLHAQKVTESAIQKLRRGPKKENHIPKSAKSGQDLKSGSKHVKIKDYDGHSDNYDSKPLLPNIKVKCEQPDSDSENSSFVDPVESPCSMKKYRNSPEPVDIKQEVIDLKYPNSISNIGYAETKVEPVIKQESSDSLITVGSNAITQPVPIKLEDLDGIDMMTLPVELADDCSDVLEPEATADEPDDSALVEADDSLMETTHANFLSLVRALFPARSAHRASRRELHSRCVALMRSPIAPLNTWYSLSDDWCAELDSALEFLAGEKGPHPDDFVPYLQFMTETQMYQWIGAGRDCDAILGRLCERWLRARSTPIAPPTPPPLPPSSSPEPLPPRYPSTWVVRAPTYSELSEFRAQERRRFASAAKSFTYIQHGYRAVVGPSARAPASRAAHAALLTADRPRQVSFVALVRDAAARLPNGEGTRHDVLTLLRMSQWISPCSEQTLVSAVSAVLDRLHSAKRDPAVRYIQRTGLWVYLHRHRTEEEWERGGGGRGRARTAPKEAQAATPTPALEVEVASHDDATNGSDSDVDVDDTGHNSTPHITPQQLLLQTAQQPVKPAPPLPPARQASHLPKPSKPTQAQVLQQQTSAAHQVTQPPKSSPLSHHQVSMPQKSPLAKQRQVQKTEVQPLQNSIQPSPQHTSQGTVQTTVTSQASNKIAQGTRSLLLRGPSMQTPVSVSVSTSLPSSAQVNSATRRGVVRVLSPATPASGKSLISPRALMQQGNQAPARRRAPVQNNSTVTTSAQSTTNVLTTVVSSVSTVVSSSGPTRTVQLAGGRTVQLAANQTVHLPGGQAVQLSSGHTLQLSSLQLPMHSVRLPSGQTVQLASPQTVRAVSAVRNSIPRLQQPCTTIRTSQTNTQTSQATVQLPSGQTVQLAGQSVQLTSHGVKLGQSVQLAGQSVQLPSGQNVQLTSGQNIQTVQLAGQNVQLGPQTVQLPSGQTVQLSGQTVQLPSGQTVQLSSGQTIQLSSGQTVQLSGQATPRSVAQQVVRPSSAVDKVSQPLVAKLLTNAQGQVISLEGMMGGARTLQLAGMRPQSQKTLQTLQGMGVGGVRVVSAAGARVARPLLLTSKPLHNIILQQGDANTVRATSSSGATVSQTLVLSNLAGQTVNTTATSSAPLLKLQQVNPMHQVKLSQGIKIQQAGAPGTGAVRGMLVDGQQLKLVGGRHVLARLLRPAPPH